MTRRYKFVAPVPQWRDGQGWVLARQPKVTDAYRLLFRGQHVGWLIVAEDGWRWQTDSPRGSYTREVTSRVVFDSWPKAAAAATMTAWARRVAGRVIRPGQWQRSYLLAGGRKPWTPRPVKQPMAAR